MNRLANGNLIVACRTLESAKKLADGVKNATPISLDVSDSSALDAEVAKHDLVIRFVNPVPEWRERERERHTNW